MVFGVNTVELGINKMLFMTNTVVFGGKYSNIFFFFKYHGICQTYSGIFGQYSDMRLKYSGILEKEKEKK